MENLNPSTWKHVQTARPPARNNNKILWWKQKVISKKELREIVKRGNKTNGELNIEN